jgi:hypothetical protein
MSYVLFVLALWPDPMLAPYSHNVHAWSRTNTRQECELKAIEHMRKRNFLLLYSACSVDPPPR